MKFSLDKIENILNDESKRNILIDYCKYLTQRYSDTLEGKYRIKYNDLYSLLYQPNLSNSQKFLFFNSFANSLDIHPIVKSKNLKLKQF